MKKLITITTILAAGTLAASAATTIDVTTVATENLVLAWNFDTSSTANVAPSSVTLNNVFTYNSDGYGTSDSTSGRTWSTNFSGAGMYANAFTISFDVSNFTSSNWGNVFSLYTDSGTTTSNALMIQKNGGDGVMMYIGAIEGGTTYFGGSTTSANGTFASYTTLNSSAWTTLTFSSDGSNFYLYVNGEKIATLELATTSTVITGFQFGTGLGNSHASTSVNFDNIAFWNTTLSDAQVASLCATPVPEPSMFGFLAGTLALGLASARRRRAKK